MTAEDISVEVSTILDRLDEGGSPEDLQKIHDDLVSLVQTAVAKEREACALLAEAEMKSPHFSAAKEAVRCVLEGIRQRGR